MVVLRERVEILRVQVEVGGRRRLGGWTRALVGLLVFLGVGAVGGGTAMVLAPDGDLIGMDPDWLADVPLIDDWLVPGVFLALVLGLGSLVAAYGVVRRPQLRWARGLERATGQHVAWAAALALGVVLVGFIAYEATVITAPEGRWMQWLMGTVGVALVALTASAPVRRDLRR